MDTPKPNKNRVHLDINISGGGKVPMADRKKRVNAEVKRLTELGLPTPNLSCGEHNLHSPLEFTCLEEMATAVKVLMAATTIAAVRVIEKKNKKAAAIALIAMNGVTAAVVVNNMKNARR